MKFLVLALIFLLPGCASMMGSGQSQFDVELKGASKIGMDPATKKTSRALHHYLSGQLAYQREDFDAALEQFSKASADIPEPATQLHMRLAELYLKKGDLEAALAESNKAAVTSPNNPKQLLLRAGILESLGHNTEAEEAYRQILNDNPDRIDAYLFLSGLFARENKLNEATNILKKLVARSPSEALGHYYLGRSYEQQGKLDLAWPSLKKAAELNSERPEFVSAAVRVMLKLGKDKEIKSFCTSLLDRNPNNLLVRKLLGDALIGQNKFEEALEQLKLVEGMEEDPVDTRFKIALIELERRNVDEAVRELSLVLAQRPDHDEARYYLASLYAGTSRRHEALDELEKIKKGSDMFVKSRIFGAVLSRQDGDLARAEQFARAALEVDEDKLRALPYLISILRDAGKYREAANLLKTASDEDPKNEGLLFNYGLVLEDLGEADLSFEVMNKVLALNPDNADALNYIAYGLAERGQDLARAEELAEKANKLKPNDGYFLDSLGWIYFRRGNLAAAEETLGRAVALVADDEVIVEHYADVLAAQGRSSAALETYRTALGKAVQSKEREAKESAARIREKIAKLEPHS